MRRQAGMTLLETMIATAIVVGSISIAASAISSERGQMLKTAAGFDAVAMESAVRHSLRAPLKRAYETDAPCLDIPPLVAGFAGHNFGGFDFVAPSEATQARLTSSQKDVLTECTGDCLILKLKDKGDRQIAVVRLTAVALDYRTQRKVVCDNDLVEENQYASGVRYEIHPSFAGKSLATAVGFLTHIALADQRSAAGHNNGGTQYHVPAFWLANQASFPLPKVPKDGDPLWSTSDMPFKQLTQPAFRGGTSTTYVVPKNCTASISQLLASAPNSLPDCQPCFRNGLPGCQGR